MRNKYPGKCYRCGQPVGPGDGHAERYGHGWRVQHAGCATLYRGSNQHHVTTYIEKSEKQ